VEEAVGEEVEEVKVGGGDDGEANEVGKED